ncbi:hypothetical protein U0070_025873, partial [Myodes glareolus]
VRKQRTRSRPTRQQLFGEEGSNRRGERVRGGKAGPTVSGRGGEYRVKGGDPGVLRCAWTCCGHALPHPVPHSWAPHSAGTLPHWAHVTFYRAGLTGKGAAGIDVCSGATSMNVDHEVNLLVEEIRRLGS